MELHYCWMFQKQTDFGTLFAGSVPVVPLVTLHSTVPEAVFVVVAVAAAVVASLNDEER